MEVGLRKVFFDNFIQNFLTEPLPFPVNQWNEPAVQKSAVKIPENGQSRAISKYNGCWSIVENPTLGVE
jgi:hypothetical protein